MVPGAADEANEQLNVNGEGEPTVVVAVVGLSGIPPTQSHSHHSYKAAHTFLSIRYSHHWYKAGYDMQLMYSLLVDDTND